MSWSVAVISIISPYKTADITNYAKGNQNEYTDWIENTLLVN